MDGAVLRIVGGGAMVKFGSTRVDLRADTVTTQLVSAAASSARGKRPRLTEASAAAGSGAGAPVVQKRRASAALFG